jgi:predicted secreted hydrolase
LKMKLLLFMLGLVLIIGCKPQDTPQDQSSSISVASRMGSKTDAGFQRVTEPREFVFPLDHGPHKQYATEWWYFTGNLTGQHGHTLGYQLTLFRIGLKPGTASGDSDWRSHQIMMGHLAVSDIKNVRHWSEERFSRLGAGLAGAETTPLNIWLGSWTIRGQSESELFPLQLRADTPEIAIDIKLDEPAKPMVLQGDQGFSRKGEGSGNASYYYSFTRLPTSGSIRIGEQDFQVMGNSWFDREWSSSALAPDQAGWDWFALQLEDGRDLMFYRMRDKQGRAQVFSGGVLVDQNGDSIKLNLQNTHLEPIAHWKSDDGIRYPLRWKLGIPGQQIDLTIEAAFEDQEMQHSVRYWEGAVRVTGSHRGLGYLELSGYSAE